MQRCLVQRYLVMPGLVAVLITSLTAFARTAQPSTVLDGVYTTEQAERGRRAYRQFCTYCHHDDLLGGEDLKVVPPALVGLAFTEQWVGKTVGGYFNKVSGTMPWERTPLTAPVYADIVAYIFKENGYPAGTQELPVDAARLDAIQIVPPR